MNKNKLIGRWGELKAAEYLRKKHYSILEMGYTSRFGEIDIIAEDAGTVVFVEVKLRKTDDYARASDYVTPQKQKRLMLAARCWLAKNDADVETRFDVMEIYAPSGIETEKPQIIHTEGAFWES